MGHGWHLAHDIYIKKLYFSKSENRRLTFSEIQTTELRDFWTSQQFEDAGLGWVGDPRTCGGDAPTGVRWGFIHGRG